MGGMEKGGLALGLSTAYAKAIVIDRRETDSSESADCGMHVVRCVCLMMRVEQRTGRICGVWLLCVSLYSSSWNRQGSGDGFLVGFRGCGTVLVWVQHGYGILEVVRYVHEASAFPRIIRS